MLTVDEQRRRRPSTHTPVDGDPFPEATLASLKTTGVGIKGPTTTPIGAGFRSINVLLRKELDRGRPRRGTGN